MMLDRIMGHMIWKCSKGVRRNLARQAVQWAAMIVLALLVTALGVRWKSYSTAKHERAQAEAESRRTFEESCVPT